MKTKSYPHIAGEFGALGADVLYTAAASGNIWWPRKVAWESLKRTAQVESCAYPTVMAAMRGVNLETTSHFEERFFGVCNSEDDAS